MCFQIVSLYCTLAAHPGPARGGYNRKGMYIHISHFQFPTPPVSVSIVDLRNKECVQKRHNSLILILQHKHLENDK